MSRIYQILSGGYATVFLSKTVRVEISLERDNIHDVLGARRYIRYRWLHCSVVNIVAVGVGISEKLGRLDFALLFTVITLGDVVRDDADAI